MFQVLLIAHGLIQRGCMPSPAKHKIRSGRQEIREERTCSLRFKLKKKIARDGREGMREREGERGRER